MPFGLKLLLDKRKIRKKLTNDEFGKAAARHWKRLINPYTPRDTGELMGRIGKPVKILPFKIHYMADYSEIVYDNIRGVKFITFGTNRNPFATDHWDVKAEAAGQKEKLYRALNTDLRKGKI